VEFSHSVITEHSIWIICDKFTTTTKVMYNFNSSCTKSTVSQNLYNIVNKKHRYLI
jgi:hypothetical protein